MLQGLSAVEGLQVSAVGEEHLTAGMVPMLMRIVSVLVRDVRSHCLRDTVSQCW